MRQTAGRAARVAVWVVCSAVLFQFVSLYLTWQKQAMLGAASLLLSMAIHRRKGSQAVTLAMMLLSVAATLRYGWWRVHRVLDFFATLPTLASASTLC